MYKWSIELDQGYALSAMHNIQDWMAFKRMDGRWYISPFPLCLPRELINRHPPLNRNKKKNVFLLALYQTGFQYTYIERLNAKWTPWKLSLCMSTLFQSKCAFNTEAVLALSVITTGPSTCTPTPDMWYRSPWGKTANWSGHNGPISQSLRSKFWGISLLSMSPKSPMLLPLFSAKVLKSVTQTCPRVNVTASLECKSLWLLSLLARKTSEN